MPEFSVHTNLLHETLHGFVSNRASGIGETGLLGSGLLPPRFAEGRTYRPRVVVVPGLAEVIPDTSVAARARGLFVVGLMRDETPDVRFSHLAIIQRHNAHDMLMGGDPPRTLTDVDILRLGHAVRIAEPEILPPNDHEQIYRRIVGQILTKLGIGLDVRKSLEGLRQPTYSGRHVQPA